MKKMILLSLALAVLAAPSVAQKISIDYARDYDFDQVQTFTFFDTEETNTQNDLWDQRIKSKIIEKLTTGEDALKQVDSGGDIYVTYHVATEDNTVFNTTTFGYGGWGPGWGGWGGYGYYGGLGMGSSTTTASTYTEGTLVLDAYEPKEKKMVWRGTGTVTLKGKPEKVNKQIDKILNKMDKRWDKIHTGQGK